LPVIFSALGIDLPPQLVLHDTTEFSYHREDPDAIGILQKLASPYASGGKPGHHITCGVLMHSSLVVTTDGLPLGLAAIKFWTREKFHGANALKRSINPTRVPNEPGRIVHIGDSESDIYELFSIAHQAGTHFLLRTCVDRLAGDGGHTVADEMREAQVQGMHRVQVRDKKDAVSEAVVEIRYRRIWVLAPVAKQKMYPPLMLTALHATERDPPKGREPVDWKLVTDLPIRSRKDAVEKLNWYAMRWKIETFHKILKSGCKAEDVKLRTAERLVNLIAILYLLSWRVFWMTMLNRTSPEASPQMALTPTEIYLLDQLVGDSPSATPTGNQLSLYLTKLARLGGYLARAKDPPPGNTVMWRGMTRLTDIQLGFILGTKLMGN
jgi:hypothetical protein